MPPPNSGGIRRSTKNDRPLLFGSSFVNLFVGPRNRQFAVHEDVLCSRSTYFKKRLQRVRKEATGECTICLENLHEAETVFCRECGRNFHDKCMVRWLRTQSNECPVCRTAWKKAASNSATHTLDQLDPDGFEVYIQWLYAQRIPSYAVGTAEDQCMRLIKAHLVGSALEDRDFLLAVRVEIISIAAEHGLSYNTVDFAYKSTHEPCHLRRFLADLYALTGSSDSLKGGHVSHLFLIDMAQSFVEKSRQPAEGETVWTRMAAEGYVEVQIEGGQP